MGAIDELRYVSIQSLTTAELVKFLQRYDGDDDVIEIVEAELARRQGEGAPPQ
jgi:hypothetical protein